MALLLGIVTRDMAGGRTQDLQSTPVTTVIIPKDPTPLPGVPIKTGGKTLFFVCERIEPLSPAERADLINKKLNQLADDPFSPPLEITLAETAQEAAKIIQEKVWNERRRRQFASNSITLKKINDIQKTSLEISRLVF